MNQDFMNPLFQTDFGGFASAHFFRIVVVETIEQSANKSIVRLDFITRNGIRSRKSVEKK
jgi:hypothetical protein